MKHMADQLLHLHTKKVTVGGEAKPSPASSPSATRAAWRGEKCVVCEREVARRHVGAGLQLADVLVLLDAELHRAELEGAQPCRCQTCRGATRLT